MKVAVFSLLVLSLVVIFSTGTAHAADDGSMIYVNGSSGNDTNDGYTWLTAKQTIGNATGTVATNGMVTIANGTYTGKGNVGISITKDMTITGVDQNGTIIDGGGSSQIFNIASGVTVTIENLTLTNGYAYNGGTIYNRGNLTIQNCNINNNTATNYGGGIYNGSYGTCTVTDSTISNNTAKYGGGIVNNYGTCNVTDSYITGNTATFGGGIANAGICTVTGSTITGNWADYGGGIYNDYGTCTVTNSTITGNTATNWGGGMYNNANLLVIDSDLNRNTANAGGGIYNYSGTCTVTNSNINSNTATNGGGIYNDYGTCTVTNSNINSNTATNYGGGVDNENSDLNVSGCDFEFNQASYGNAIYNYCENTSNRVIQFCRFYDLADGYEIYSASGSVDAQYNWWGSNSDPTSKVYGNVDVNPWLVLTLTADPSIVGLNLTSTVTADLLHDSDGVLHDMGPNRVPVTFSTNFCNITSIVFTVDGVANATFTSGDTEGVANITAILDYQISHILVTVDAAPTITIIDPIDGTVLNDTTKVVTVTFSKDILEGTAFDDITFSCNGTALTTITKNISGNVLTLTNTTSYTDGTYTVNIPANAIIDAAGNTLETSFSSLFTVDTVAPVITSTDPVNGATNVSADKVITVTFSEPIKEGTGWFELIDRNTGTAVDFTTSINGNVLTITPTSALAEGWYKVIIHTGSVTDLAGNMVAVKSFTFSVGTSPTITSTTPLDGATNVHVAKTITVTFSEAIRKSSHFWVELVDSTGNAVAFTTYITGGNMLVINPTGDLAAGTTYKVKLHTGCVTDLAGNPVAPSIFSFTTRNT